MGLTDVLKFRITMDDLASPSLKRFGANAQSTYSKVAGLSGMVSSKNKLLSLSYNELTKQIKDTEASIAKSTIPSQIRKAKNQLAELKRMQSSHIGNVPKDAGSGGILPNMGGVGGMVAGAVSIGALYSAGKEIVMTTAKFQSLRNSINTASETAKQGEINFLWVKHFSKEYGLEVESVAEGFKTLRGAMMKTKFTSSDTRRMFEQVSSGVVALGLSSDDAKGTFLALGQMMGKGKVQAEELRGQIGERIPGAFAIAARAMKMSTSQLDKFMQDGKLMAEDFLPKFAAEMEKTFGAKAKENAHGLTQEMNRMSSSWTNLMASIGETDSNGLMGKSFAGISTGLDYISNKYFKSLQQKSKEVGTLQSAGYLEQLEVRSSKLGGRTKEEKASKLESLRNDELRNQQQMFRDVSVQLAKQQSYLLGGLGFKGKYSQEKADKILNDREHEFTNAFGVVNDKEFEKYIGLRNLQETYRASIQGAGQYFDMKISDLYENGKNYKNGSTDSTSTATDSIKGITSGGPRVININGVKFAEKIEFHVANMKEGAEESLQTFEDSFLRVLNSGAALQ